MMCMDIRLKLYFDNVASDGDNKKCERAIEELFNNILCERKEYIKTEARVMDVKEVIE